MQRVSQRERVGALGRDQHDLRRRKKIEFRREQPGVREYVACDRSGKATQDRFGALPIALLSSPEMERGEVRHHHGVRVRRGFVLSAQRPHDEIAGVVGDKVVAAEIVGPVMAVEHVHPLAREIDIVMQAAIKATPGLEVIEAAVEDLIVECGNVNGVLTADGRSISAGAVVLTTGTFLRGLIHIGERKIPAGRINEAPALGLSERLYGLGLRMDGHGYTQEDLAKVIGKSRSHLANTLRLLKLPHRVQEMVRSGQLSAGHARALIGRADAEALALRIVNEGLTVRDIEALTQEKSPRPRPSRKSKDADTRAAEAELAEALGLGVEIKKGKGEKGELRIRYTTLDQLEDLRHRLLRRRS